MKLKLENCEVFNKLIEYVEQLKYNEDKRKELTKRLSKSEGKLSLTLQSQIINKMKVRDHNHLTGEYRGATHCICNLNYKLPRFIPIYFHNFSGYDAHLFVKEFGDDYNDIKLIIF